MPVATHDRIDLREGTATAPGRIVAVDLARFVAIVGMIAAHLALIPIPGLSMIVEGPPSTLFAVLGGVSAVLASRATARRSGRLAASASLAARGLLLVPIGWLLDQAHSPAIIVLVSFGVTLIVLSPLIWLPRRVLVAIAAVLAVAGPIANVWVRSVSHLSTGGELSFASPAEFLRSVFFTSTYPVVTWLVYAIIGVLVARTIEIAIERGRLRVLGRRMLVWGLVASVVSGTAGIVFVELVIGPAFPARMTVVRLLLPFLPAFGGPLVPPGGGPVAAALAAVLAAAPHSGSTFDVARTAGLAVAVIGFFLRRSGDDGSMRLRAFGRVVRAGGAAPLTLYAVHILAFGALTALSGRAEPAPWWVSGAGGFAIQLAIVGVVAVVLNATGRRGPLEYGLSTVSRLVAWVVRSRRPIAAR